MAAAPQFKVYRQKEYVAATKYAEDAAVLVAVIGEGGSVRWGHTWTLWTEGHEEQPAGDSYDYAAGVMLQRLADMQQGFFIRTHGGRAQ